MSEVDGNTEVESNDDFDAGFADVAPTETPVAATEPEEKPEVEQPKFAQITEEQFANLMASAAEVQAIKSASSQKLDQAFGKIGGLERVIRDIQSSTPVGQNVDLSSEDFAELKAEYPELAEMQIKGLTRALAKLNIRGTGSTPDAAWVDEVVSNRLQPAFASVDARVEQLVESRLLAREHKDWREVVGTPDSNNEFRQWLGKQAPEFQREINSTNDSGVISEAITRFKSTKKSTPDASSVSQRKARIEAAITPRGTGAVSSSASDDDDFNEGFQKG